MTSTPTEFHSEQLMEMSKNNQNFMKNIPKSDRLEYFAPWVNSEKTQYSVEGNFDIKSKKVCKYSLLDRMTFHDQLITVPKVSFKSVYGCPRLFFPHLK